MDEIPKITNNSDENIMNNQLFAFLEERKDYYLPHSKETVDALFRMSRDRGAHERALLSSDLAQLVLLDPSFAINFSRFAREEGHPLDAMNPLSLKAAMELLNPFFVLSSLAPTEDHTQVFLESPKVAKIYRRICAEVKAHIDKVICAADERDADLVALMVLSASAGWLAIASMAPSTCLPVLTAGNDVDKACQACFGFRMSELAQHLEEHFALPRPNDPIYSPKVRILVRDVCVDLRDYLKQPASKAA